jgi:hypothetical protein
MTDTAYSDKAAVLIVSTTAVFLVPFDKVGDITAFLFFKALWLEVFLPRWLRARFIQMTGKRARFS